MFQTATLSACPHPLSDKYLARFNARGFTASLEYYALSGL
jgi:hypothetical protein